MPGIVLTTDLSAESKRAFGPVRELARRLGLDVTLLSVLEDVAYEAVAGGVLAVGPDRMQMRRDHQREMDRLVAEFAGSGVRVKGVVLEAADVPRVIVQHANAEKADFLAMATHGRTGLRRLLLGSVAEQVVRHAHVPVLLYPPEA
jgi:nucleotide-binding universal stress UspA family protein